MNIPSIYLNLDDDVSKIVQRIKREKSPSLILVFPKKSFLFSDSINLRLLKKQTDLLSKEVFVLTMDEKGQLFAQEAGFQLKFLPKVSRAKSFSDIQVNPKITEQQKAPNQEVGFLDELKQAARNFVPAVTAKLKSEDGPKAPEETEPAVAVSQTAFPEEIKVDYKEPQEKSFTPKIVTATVAVSLILILTLVFFILPKATVLVYPKSEPLTRDMEISMSTNLKEIDSSALTMPAQKIEETLAVSNKFESQGKKQVGNRASGLVKIYNFTPLPLNLKASTTILSMAGKSYNLINDISGLKPVIYKNAKTKEIDESSVGEAVTVIASGGGEDYNLPAGTRLEITNQVFGSRPQLLYAKTDSEIKGGTTRYLSVISQEDTVAAKNSLQEQAINELRKKLESQGLVLADKAFTAEVLQFTTNNAVGTETPTFETNLQIKVLGLAFKKSDLKDLIFKRINETLALNKTLRPKNPDQTAYKTKTLDLNNQLAILEVHFEGHAVYNLNLPYIAPELVGKTKSEVNEILRSKAEIDRVDIILAPSWQKNFPFFANKIEVSVAQSE